MENESSNRRRFFSKLVGLAALGGVAGLLHVRETPSVKAADGANVTVGNTVDGSNPGNSTAITGHCPANSAFFVSNDKTEMNTVAILGRIDNTSPGGYSAGVRGENYGESTLGIGVYGSHNGSGWGVCGRTPSGYGVIGRSDGASGIPIVARGDVSQTADLQQWQNSVGGALSVINKVGRLGIGTAAPVDMVHVVAPAGQDANIRFEGGGNVTGFVLKNTGTGGRDWRIRVNKNTITPNGGLVFQDDSASPPTPRMVIDASGNVGVGTDNPTSKLHVNGRVKAQGYDTGDIKFANDYSVTEDEKDGVAFLNAKGTKIAVLDSEGNFHIKGKVMEDL